MRNAAVRLLETRHRRHSADRERGPLFFQQFNLCVGAIALMNAARLGQSWVLLQEKCIFVKLMMHGRLFFSRELPIVTASFLIEKLSGTAETIIGKVEQGQDTACGQQGS